MSMEESISLEETNKIRISLGLKPLTDDKAPALDSDKAAENNYSQLREDEAKERETKKIQDRIAKVRNRRELNASLKGATLGDADGDVDDTLKWIKRNKRKEKDLAQKRQQELESRDKEILGEYSERDLEGLKVSHDFDEMDDGESRILTLKDSRLLDNEEDELQNVEMAEDEKLKKRLELKVKKHDYKGYDDEEFKEGNQGLLKLSILAKYNEEIEGSRQSTFRLGSSTLSGKTQREDQKQQTAVALKKSLLTIDYSKTLETNDYVQDSKSAFKKSKTKKKRSNRRAADSELHDNETMDVEEAIVSRTRNLDANFVDDDELQAALARSRQAKLFKTKKLSPEELAKKIALDLKKEISYRNAAQEEPEDERGLTFDETSEFVQAVGNEPIVKPERERKEPSLPSAPVKTEFRDVSMAPGDVVLEELEAGEVQVKDEDEDVDMDTLDALENAIEHTEDEEKVERQKNGEIGVGTSSEQHFVSGMAATLNILRQQGVLAQPNAEQSEREKVQKHKDFWLEELRQKQMQRDLERLQARGAHKDQSQREYENRLREQQEAREQMEMFKNYKPDVDLSYHDENGRKQTSKEAWKALSHKFHGKGSGKMKTEKRLKKITDEKKKEAMASGDTPLSMSRAFQIRQEKTGQVHFVLSVGNRGAVPQAADFLDPQPLAKGKTEKTKKKKESKSHQATDSGFMTVPAPSLHLTSNGTSVVPSTSASPAPKAGFSRITSAVLETSSQGSTPVPAERPKVAFGLGVKRKAGEEAPGSPHPKKR